MSQNLFFTSAEFLAGIQALNLRPDDEEAVDVFRNLLLETATDTVGSGLMVTTLAAILDRVAYFPLRPADMQVPYLAT
jgi:hypothetical protein